MPKGLFIVLEGPDRSGKSTQAALLKEWLKKTGRDVLLTREPGGTAVSEKVREILLDPAGNVAPMTELFLFETARMQHTLEIIKPALAAGKAVISDRFTMSTSAYQGYGRGLPLDKVETLNYIATEGLTPDVTFVFDLPEQEFAGRARETELSEGPDRIERESADFRKKVAEAYRELSRGQGIIKINAAGTVEEIQLAIRKELKRVLVK